MPQAPWGCFYDGQPPATPGGTSTNIGFFVERGTNQTLPGFTETVINLDTVIEESSPGLVDLAGDRFVCPTAGRYGFCLSLDISFSGFFAFGELRMYVDSGAGYIRRTDERAENDIEDYIKIGNSFYFQLAVGDFVQPRAYNGDSFSATLVGCNNQFSGALIATP